MVNWIFVIIIVLAFYIFAKTTGFRYGRTITYIVGILLGFVVITFIFVIIKSDVDLTSFDGFVSGIKTYAVWLGNFGKTTASISSNAVSEFSSNITEAKT